MNNNIFIKEVNTNQINLNNNSIVSFADMINIILNNPNTKYHFANFTKEELKIIRQLVKKRNNNFLINKHKNEITIVTHALKYKIKKYYSLDNLYSLEETPVLTEFETVDQIKLEKIGKKYIIVIEGITSIYGINNEYGFYNIDKDEFIPNSMLNDIKDIKIEVLRDQQVLHYVRKRVR